MKLAIFDFDGTIYRKETFSLLMQELKRTYPEKYRRFYTVILPVYLGYKLKLIDEPSMKSQLMKRYIQALNGLPEASKKRFFFEVAHAMEGDFNQQVIKRLKEHQAAGDYTMILSGAFTPLLAAVDDELSLHADGIVGTKPVKYGETFVHVHAEKKIEFLKGHLKSMEIDWEASYAYGDSASDLSILELVGHPVAVSPDAILKSHANTYGWEIIEE